MELGLSRCRVEAELRLPAHWHAAEVLASRVQALRGDTSDAVAERVRAEVLAGRPVREREMEALGFAVLTPAEREEIARRLDAALARDPVRREEARARAAVMAALEEMRARAEAERVVWAELTVKACARSGPEEPSRGSWVHRLGVLAGPGERRPWRTVAGRAPHVSVRIGITLEGEHVAIERTLERDLGRLEQAGEVAWFTQSFEERRRRRRDTRGNDAPGAAKLPPAGARLLSLLRECAACLAAEDEGAAFTVARALAIFAQSQPEITRLLMRDPRAIRLNEGFAADEPADVDFELQKCLRALQARHNLAGLYDLFCNAEPRMGLLRLIEHRIRSEAEQNASPFYAAAFARVFGDADNALLHLRAMESDGLLLPPRTPSGQADESPALAPLPAG